MDEITLFRGINFILSLIVLIVMIIRFPLWREQTMILRFYGTGLFLMVIYMMYVNVETISLGVDGGPRIFILTVILTFLTIASLLPRKAGK